MATTEQILAALEQFPSTGEFRPYIERSKEANAINVYFRPDAEYSKRLTDHVTLFLSHDSDEIVGCRIKGVGELLEDLPNFIEVNHKGVELRIIFLACRWAADSEYAREAFKTLARESGELTLEPCQ